MTAILPQVQHALLFGLLPDGYLPGEQEGEEDEQGKELTEENFPTLAGSSTSKLVTRRGAQTAMGEQPSLDFSSRMKLAQLTDSFHDLWPEDIEAAFRRCGCNADATVAALRQANPGTTYV